MEKCILLFPGGGKEVVYFPSPFLWKISPSKPEVGRPLTQASSVKANKILFRGRGGQGNRMEVSKKPGNCREAQL